MDLEDLSKCSITELMTIAETYHAQKQYGKAFSIILFTFKLHDGSWKQYREFFIHNCLHWIAKLVERGDFPTIQSNLLTVKEVVPQMFSSLSCLCGRYMFDRGCHFHAIELLQFICYKVHFPQEANFYDCIESLDYMKNVAVDRWHFRMLNDTHRNQFFQSAIIEAFNAGHRSILDVGSGTGLFSYYAADIGYENIYACEMSEVMCKSAKTILCSHNMIDKVTNIDKESFDVEVPSDIPNKATVLVTETFDCGLLGEGIITIVLDAFERLLKHNDNLFPPCTVIPSKAAMYGICVECEQLRKHSKYTSQDFVVNGTHDSEDLVLKQPYTSEDMKHVRGGYNLLSSPFLLDSFEFDNPEQLKQKLGESHIVSVDVEQNGSFDAVIVYFTLHDGPYSISTSPLSEKTSCWEQAVYNMDSRKVQVGEVIDLFVTCHERHVSLSVQSITTEQINSSNSADEYLEPILEGHQFFADRRLVARMNDSKYTSIYHDAIQNSIGSLGKKKSHPSILICCSLYSLIPAMVERCLTDADFTNVLVQGIDSDFLKHSCRHLKQINFDILAEELENRYFDIVIVEPVDPNGLLGNDLMRNFTYIISKCCIPSTIFIPHSVECQGMLISSKELQRQSLVLDDSVTLGMAAAPVMNKYQVNCHPDIDLSSIEHKVISKERQLFKIDFDPLKDLSAIECQEVEFSIDRSGSALAMAFWFQLTFSSNQCISTRGSDDDHWHQAVTLINRQVCDGDKLQVQVTRNMSNIHINIKDVKY